MPPHQVHTEVVYLQQDRPGQITCVSVYLHRCARRRDLWPRAVRCLLTHGTNTSVVGSCEAVGAGGVSHRLSADCDFAHGRSGQCSVKFDIDYAASTRSGWGVAGFVLVLFVVGIILGTRTAQAHFAQSVARPTETGAARPRDLCNSASLQSNGRNTQIHDAASTIPVPPTQAGEYHGRRHTGKPKPSWGLLAWPSLSVNAPARDRSTAPSEPYSLRV